VHLLFSQVTNLLFLGNFIDVFHIGRASRPYYKKDNPLKKHAITAEWIALKSVA
jgi:hypothetical protein